MIMVAARAAVAAPMRRARRRSRRLGVSISLVLLSCRLSGTGAPVDVAMSRSQREEGLRITADRQPALMDGRPAPARALACSVTTSSAACARRRRATGMCGPCRSAATRGWAAASADSRERVTAYRRCPRLEAHAGPVAKSMGGRRSLIAQSVRQGGRRRRTR